MAYKKKPKLPEPLQDDHFTKSEIDILCQLIYIYVSKLSTNLLISTKEISSFNRQGLYELGIHSKDEWVSKLLKHYAHNTIAENILVAYGYVKLTSSRLESNNGINTKQPIKE